MGKHKSIQTNPAIANVFFRCGFIEAWGRGIEKICRECDKSGNSYPVFDISDCGFMVRFDALKSALIDNVAQNDTQGDIQGNDLDIWLEAAIRKNPKITTEELARKCNKSIITIKRHIAKLPHIQFKGSGYSGHWEIVTAGDSEENEKK